MRFVRDLFLAVVLLIVAVVAGRLLMPWAGRRLIRSDPLAKADLIVVLGSFRIERTLEAGMLYREGFGPKIMLLRPPDVVRDRLRQELHLQLPVYLDIQKEALLQMGVPASAIIPSPRVADSTRTEAEGVADYVRQSGDRRIIIVTSPYHTARAGYLFDRAARGSFQVIVHRDRYEPFNPDRWWIDFPDRSDVVLEYLKRIYALFW